MGSSKNGQWKSQFKNFTRVRVRVTGSSNFLLEFETSFHNLLKSLSRPIRGTNQYWRHLRNHGRHPCGVRSHDPEVERQTR